ncbi:MAG: PEP-CTERM sorting domain-containing protein [Phycisphaerales bacterium]|nr:PEP-CTERM sorting domain-containing protein [Phycisphaerales bacterium]MCB9857629.1 PEP-CTERM sorting domain-containing protein [Phycisphaerales bacterium]MCB9864814.1 PEP-CTERM sorting domain-containing protein [Phycisphaerales bacterium]
MKRYLLSVAMVLAGVVQTSVAATITGITQQPVGNVNSVIDTGDGTWDMDEDWGYNEPQNRVWMNETWIGSYGDNLGIDSTIDVSDTRGATSINFRKNLNNTTNFDWTDFHIDLLPNPSGGAISNVTALPNAAFGNVMVMDNMDGTYSIWWDNFTGGSGVPIGGMTSLDFSLDITGSIAFKMVQHPTPEPATLSLLAIGGLALIRRRR